MISSHRASSSASRSSALRHTRIAPEWWGIIEPANSLSVKCRMSTGTTVSECRLRRCLEPYPTRNRLLVLDERLPEPGPQRSFLRFDLKTTHVSHVCRDHQHCWPRREINDPCEKQDGEAEIHGVPAEAIDAAGHQDRGVSGLQRIERGLGATKSSNPQHDHNRANGGKQTRGEVIAGNKDRRER